MIKTYIYINSQFWQKEIKFKNIVDKYTFSFIAKNIFMISKNNVYNKKFFEVINSRKIKTDITCT